jgi:hypothetical protein
MQRKSGLPITGIFSRVIPPGLGYVAGASLPIAGLTAFALPGIASGSVIVQYDIVASSATGQTVTNMETPTASSSLVTANNLVLGSTTASTANSGGAALAYYTNDGNSLSVSNNNASENSDNGWSVEIVVQANAGYEMNLTGFTLVGGAGGGSDWRTLYVYDNQNGTPTSITPTGGANVNTTNAPTIVGGTLLGSGNLTTGSNSQSGSPSLRSSSDAMDVFVTNLSSNANDQNLTTQYDLFVYFDAQQNTGKNIDLGNLELDGTVVAVPEPAKLSLVGLVGMVGLGRRRRRALR